MHCTRPFLLFFLTCLCERAAIAQDSYVTFSKETNAFQLAGPGKASPIYVSDADYPGVLRAARDLKSDIGKVTDSEPELRSSDPVDADMIIVGTIGKNQLVDALIKNKKLDVSAVAGKWEGFTVAVVEKPFPNVNQALVIAGNDKRGTTFGIYDLSRQIGVSPWYWWADVPPKKNKNIFARAKTRHSEFPDVKYRGIFLNDEEPALGRFVVQNYGGFKHEFYEKVFELILRLKGNYLWPAMWWASFNSDDPLNPKLADEYGIVMGTSHHEPMMRAHSEWKTYNGGDWNYETNAATLKKFWTEGIQRMGNNESIVTLAMRGDGDMAMSKDTKINVLGNIVAGQRKILQEITGKDVTTIPQVWALYKEVQDYYDQGMRVPDDVTLLLSDDNWGNLRKLPRLTDHPRKGGYGIYYHFDYVGDPRNYKWLNTNPIIKVWEQMHLAHSYGADQLWIVNVGDLKPMEFPISFFLDYAWKPGNWTQNDLGRYTTQWCADQFGSRYASRIAEIITTYTKYNGRRKPELLTPETYSQINYHEAEQVVSDYRALEKEADVLYDSMPVPLKDAFYELILYPVRACANLNDLYVTSGKNRLYALQNRSLTNALGERVKELYQKDQDLSNYYNHTLANGKWNNMMNQIHMGYTYWQDPKEAVMPAVKTTEIAATAKMGVAAEGSELSASSGNLHLPEFNSHERTERYFDVFNQGRAPFNYSIVADVPWILLSSAKGTTSDETRIHVTIDWPKAPFGATAHSITVQGAGEDKVIISAIVTKERPLKSDAVAFIETNHVVSMEAGHYSKAIGNSKISWQVLPHYGRTLSGVTPFPVTAPRQTIGKETPRLEYEMYLTDTTTVTVGLHLGTTLAFNANEGLRVGISFDDEIPVVLNTHDGETPAKWGKTVEDNERVIFSEHKIPHAGKHLLKYWMVDPAVVLQKVVVNAGGVADSYLGPPESPRTRP